jgi:hypothetical protein
MNHNHIVYVRGVREKENVHEVGTVGECASEDAVEEAVPHHGVEPNQDLLDPLHQDLQAESRTSFAAAGGMDGSPTAAAVATARPRVGGEKGEGSGVPERRRQSSSSWWSPRAAMPSPRASTPTPRAAAPWPRASPASRGRVASGTGTGTAASRLGTGTGDSDPDLRRCESLLGQNEKGEIRNGSISIPGQAEPNSYSGAGQESKRATSIRRIEFRSGPNRRNRTSPHTFIIPAGLNPTEANKPSMYAHHIRWSKANCNHAK